MKAHIINRDSLRQFYDDLSFVPLVGHDNALVYKYATINIWENVPTDILTPCQRYVLRNGIHRTRDMFDTLFHTGRGHVNIDRTHWFRVEGEPDPIPLTPPIIEVYRDIEGKQSLIIADGMHRVYNARCLFLPITCCVINYPSHPYYAYPNKNGWHDVQVIDELTEDFKRKDYREPDDYKALFRDYNSVFTGIQKTRTKMAA